MFRPLVPVPRVARYTWSRQWRAEAFQGVAEGVFGLAPFVAMRSLGAPPWVAPLFTVFGQALWLAAPAWEVVFARFHARHAFLWMGALANAPLLAIAFLDVTPIGEHGRGTGNTTLFIGAMAILYAVGAAKIPLRAALIHANYPRAIRGWMFGWLSTISRVTMIASSKLGGLVLDRDARWLRVVFPLAAIFSFGEHWVLSRITWHRHGRTEVRAFRGIATARAAIADGWRRSGRILREDHAFRTFELGFMLYGMGFLASFPMIAIYAERDLGLSTNEWTWATGFAHPVTYVVTIALLGRVVDRLGVVRATGFAFLFLSGFFASLPLVTGAGGMVAAYAALGFVMAAVNLGWNLGPLHFAPIGQGRAYSTVHMWCVGGRSAVAPFIGYVLSEVFSIRVAFLVSAGMVVTGAVTMFALARRPDAQREAPSMDTVEIGAPRR